MRGTRPTRIRTVAEAKTRLSEILRLAEKEGPQHIGVRRSSLVLPVAMWRKKATPPQPPGK